VTPAVKFLVWENTTRKELQPLELTSKLTTEFAYNGTSRGCIKNVIGKLTIWHYKWIEMHVKDAIAIKQNVTLWANWRSGRSRYKRIQLCRTDLHKGSSPVRIRLKSYFQGKLFIFRANCYFQGKFFSVPPVKCLPVRLCPSLFFEHYNRILLCEWVIELCSIRLVDSVTCHIPQCFPILSRRDKFRNWHPTAQ